MIKYLFIGVIGLVVVMILSPTAMEWGIKIKEYFVGVFKK